MQETYPEERENYNKKHKRNKVRYQIRTENQGAYQSTEGINEENVS